MENLNITGKIYDIQGFSVHDGPGIRTVVFLKGCPLRCPWCHSPESQSFKNQMSFNKIRCIGVSLCGECLKVCPNRALGLVENFSTGEKSISWNAKACTSCGACAQVCFPAALSMCGKDYTVGEVMEIVKKDIDYFKSSGGGVTISGGEALSQIDFTEALLKELKKAGIHTAVDTTGFCSSETIERILPYTDLFLYDLKNMDNEKHKSTTGVENQRILSNARLIANKNGKLQIRIPVIPGFNDSEENIISTAKFCASMKNAVELVQLLPYHTLGSSKYIKIQKENPMPSSIKTPSNEEMNQYQMIMQSHGLNAIIH